MRTRGEGTFKNSLTEDARYEAIRRLFINGF